MNRDQMDKAYFWDIENIFKSKDEIAEKIDIINHNTDTLVAKKESFVTSSEKMYQMIHQCHIIYQELETIYVYYKATLDQDHSLDESQQDINKIQSLYVEISAKLSFIEPEILKLEDKIVFDYLESSLKLQEYARYLKLLLASKKHMLSEKEELIMSQSSLLSQMPYDLFMTMTNSDLKFEDVLDSEGVTHTIDENNYSSLIYSFDRVLRKNAFTSLITGYKNFENTIGNIYISQLKANSFNTKIRGYKNPLERALKPNEIDPAIYKSLITAVNNSLETNHDYISLRKSILQVDELNYFDMYVPIIELQDVKYTYEEGCQLVVDSLACLGTEYTDMIKQAFNEKWIDVYPNDNKYSGAYSSGTYLTKPFILLNYTDTLNDVFTLTHELGHSMQSYYTNKTQTYQQSDYKIFIAEIASTVNELLLFEHLYQTSDDKDFKSYVLNYNLDQFRSTVYRQTMFAEFELFANESYFDSKPVSPNLLSQKYLELNQKYFGSTVTDNDLISYEWLRIPHFYMNFYVYQYATCFCIAIEIVKQIKAGNQEMLANYHNFLRAGNSKDPVSIIKDMGIDVTNPQVFEDALQVYSENLEKLKEILGEK